MKVLQFIYYSPSERHIAFTFSQIQIGLQRMPSDPPAHRHGLAQTTNADL